MIFINLSDIAILNNKVSDYRCIISLISKIDAIKMMQNADLTEKNNIIKHKKFISYIKMGKEMLMFGDIEIEKIKKFSTISYAGLSMRPAKAGMQANQFASMIDRTGNITNFTKNCAGKSFFFF